MIYSMEFARTSASRTGFQIPFVADIAIWSLIARAESTYADFLKDPANHVSESGYRYTAAELLQAWWMIVEQKKRVQAFYLVSQGHFPAYQPARNAVEENFSRERTQRTQRSEPDGQLSQDTAGAASHLSRQSSEFQTPGSPEQEQFFYP